MPDGICIRVHSVSCPVPVHQIHRKNLIFCLKKLQKNISTVLGNFPVHNQLSNLDLVFIIIMDNLQIPQILQEYIGVFRIRLSGNLSSYFFVNLLDLKILLWPGKIQFLCIQHRSGLYPGDI